MLNTHHTRASGCRAEDKPCDGPKQLFHRELHAVSIRNKNYMPFLWGIRVKKICTVVCGHPTTVYQHFKGTTEAAVMDPTCSLIEASEGETLRSSANAAFSRVALPAFLPNSRARLKPFILMPCNVGLFFFYCLFSMACSMKRLWCSEANENEALLDRAHLYLLSQPCLSPLAFCMDEPRKILAEPGETQEATNLSWNSTALNSHQWPGVSTEFR